MASGKYDYLHKKNGYGKVKEVEYGDTMETVSASSDAPSANSYKPRQTKIRTSALDAAHLRNDRSRLKSEIGKIQNTLVSGELYKNGANKAAADRDYHNKYNRMKSLEKELATIDTKLKSYEYDEYLDDLHENNFGGRFEANLAQGRLSQDSSAAWNKYLSNPTDENRQLAEHIDYVAEQFGANNKKVLAEDGLISKSLANYLPQLKDQTKAQIIGGLGGAAAGAGVALGAGLLAPTPEEVVTVPTLAVKGLKTGITAASGLYSYGNMRGAAFRELISSGVDEETARAAASDEALISGLIEMADTGIDIKMLGIGKLIDNVGKFGLKTATKLLAKEGTEAATEKSIKKVVSALGKYGLNIAQEAAEEGSQEIVSIANQQRALEGNTGKADLLLNSIRKGFNLNAAEKGQVLESAAEGAKIASMLGGATMVGTGIANRAIDNRNNRMYSETGRTFSETGTVDDVIKTGLESAPETESYRLAQEIQAKREAGIEPTYAEIGKLHIENIRTINEEEGNSEINTEETYEISASEPFSHNDIREPLYNNGVNNVEFTNADRLLNELAIETQTAKLSEAENHFGENGKKAFRNYYQQENSVEDYYNGFSRFYEAGKVGLPFDKVNTVYSKGISPAVQYAAYAAGQNDENVYLKRDKSASKVFYPKGNLVINEYSEKLSKAEADFYNRLSAITGNKIEFVGMDSIADGAADGSYSKGLINAEIGTEETRYVVISHEITHGLQRTSPQEYRAYRNYAVQLAEKSNGGDVSIVEQYSRLYKTDTENAMDEVAADFTKRIFKDKTEMERFINDNIQDNRNMLEKFFDTVKAFVDKIKNAFKGDKNAMDKAAVDEFGTTISELEEARRLWLKALKATDEKVKATQKQEWSDIEENNTVKYSLNPKFARQIDNWDGKSNTIFKVGTTSDALKSIGIKDKGIIWYGTKIAKILEKHHKITRDIIKQVPNILENPVLIMKSQKFGTRIVLMGELMDSDNNPIVAVLELQPTNKGGQVLDLNIIASAYVKDDNPIGFIKRSELLYIDENKERTEKWFNAVGLQLPSVAKPFGSIGKVTYNDGNVNIEGIPFREYMQANDIQFSLKNKNLDIDSRIPFTHLRNYINVSKGDSASLNKLEDAVKGIKRGTYVNKATEYMADINRETINKALHPKSGKMNNFSTRYIDNLNAMQVLPELFREAVYIDSKPPQKSKNKGKAIQNYHHFVAPLYMNNDEYRALITAREKTNSNTLYVLRVEVLPIKKRQSVGSSANAVSLLRGLPFDISVADLVNGVNIYDYSNQSAKSYGIQDVKFSLKKPVEESGNLIALHNLTREKLEKTLKLGGFPMPSIAITKADIPHTNFGDITLVMSKSTIDPKANKKNVVYSADAWTPVFPQIEYEADRKVQSKISKKFYELANKLGYDAVRPMYNYVNDMERELQVNNGEKGIIDKLKEDTSMMNLYLADVGKEQVQPIYKEVITKLKDSEVELYEYLIKGLGKDTLLDLTPKNGESPITRRRAWLEEHEESLKTVYGDYLKKTGIPEETVNEMMSNDKIAKSLIRGAVYARNYLKNGSEKRSSEYDGEATKNAIRKAVDKGAYEEWLNKLFKGIEKSTGVYNNKDLYTPSGNRRTFKQTHYPVTLENIVKSMAGQNNGDTKNVSGFYGIKSLRAGTAERFKSIAAMHDKEGRLQHLSEEQAAAINDSLSNRLDDIINKILRTKPHSQYDNDFIMMDSIGNILVEVGDSGKYTVDNIEKIFSKYGYKINNGLAAEIRDLLFDTSQMPVNIFEAKPERAVGFDEVLAAVVPDTTDNAFIESLKSAGIENIIEYKQDDEQSRLDAVNSVDDAKFSLKRKKIDNGNEDTYNKYRWAMDNGLLSNAESAVFFENIGAIKRGEKFRKTYDGYYMIPTGENGINNTIVITDGNYIEPSIESVIKINADNETDIETFREDIYESKSGMHSSASKIVRSYEEKGILVEYKRSDIWLYDGIRTYYGESDRRTVGRDRRDNSRQRYGNGSLGESGRFSLKGDILKENVALKKYNEYLKAQMKLTKEYKVNSKQLDKLVKELIKENNSNIDKEELFNRLDGFYTYLQNSNELAWDDIKSKALDIAKDIIKESVIVNDEYYETYKDLKRFLKNTDITISEADRADFPDGYNNFRKANFGRLKLVNNGTNIDSIYQELDDMFPEYFDAEQYITAAEQAQNIVDVLDMLSEYEMQPDNYYVEQGAQFLADDIIERYFDIPQEKPTFADKKQNELIHQKIESGKKIRSMREQRDKDIKDNTLATQMHEGAKAAKTRRLKNEEIERIKQLSKERIKKLHKDKKTSIENLKNRQKEKETRMSDKRKRSILRNRIIRHINPMKTKLLKPSDNNHIPESMRTTVANILDAINLESKYSYDPLTGKRRNDNLGIPTKRTEEFLNLKEQYQDILKSDSANEIIIDPSLLGDSGAGIESIIDEVIKMRNIRLDDMTLEQLNTVWDVLRAVEASITNAGKTLSSQKYKTTSAFAEAFVSDTSSRKNKKSYTRKHYSLDLETPYTFFSHYGQAGKDFYRMLRNAQDYEQTIQSELTSKMENVVSSEQRKKLEKEIIEFTTENGDNLILSKAHIMNIYLLSKRKQAEGHLYGSGIRQPEINRKIRRGTKDIRITQEDLNKLFSNLTSKEKSIADNMQKLTLFLAEKGNKTTMSVYGYEKFTDPNYWTIKSAKEGLQQNVEEGQDLARSIRNMGAAKATVPKASNALEIGSVFEVFDNHASEMITYAAWLAPMEDANRLFNFSFRDEDGNKTGITMKDLLNRIGGERSADYWMNLMKDIQNGISMPADDAMSGIVNKAIGNVRKAAVASNIRVVVQQPTAYLRAAAVLSPENMIEGLVKGATKGNGWKKAVKYAPIAAIKKVGGFEVSSNPKQLSEILYSSETKKGKAISFAKEFPTFGAGAADAITWGAIWNACELQVEKTKTNLTVGSESFYKATAELFTEVIDQTQVVDGVLQRSQAMRSSNMLNKQATAFMGEPTLSLNLLMRTYDAWHNETIPKKRSAALKNMSRAAFALILSNVAVAIAQSAIDALRDDDEEKDYLDRFLTALTGLTGDEKTRLQLAKNIALGGNIGNSMNVLTWIPYIKDMFSICQGYTIERMDASAFGDFISAAQDAIKSFSGEGKWTMGYAATKTVMTGAKLFGSSVSNLMRDIESILRSVLIETENWKELYNMEKGMYNLNTQTSRFFDILYQALESGDSSSYDYIAEDLIENGIKPKSIESSMRAHRKNAENPKYKKEDMGAGIKLKFKEDEKKKEEKFEVDNLSSSQYIEYMHIREKILDDIISDYEAKGLGKMDVKTANSLLDAAYEYANKVSLEEASDGKYEIDEKWIRDISNKSGSYSSVASQIMQRKKKNK